MIIDLQPYAARHDWIDLKSISITSTFMFTVAFDQIFTNLPFNKEMLTITIDDENKREKLIRLLDLASTYTEKELRDIHPELFI